MLSGLCLLCTKIKVWNLLSMMADSLLYEELNCLLLESFLLDPSYWFHLVFSHNKFLFFITIDFIVNQEWVKDVGNDELIVFHFCYTGAPFFHFSVWYHTSQYQYNVENWEYLLMGHQDIWNGIMCVLNFRMKYLIV